MCSAVVLMGLALVVALQIAIHRRIANTPAWVAEHVRLEILNRARADVDALKESTAKSVVEIVNSLKQHHDRAQRYQFELHETYRTEIASLQARAHQREAHANILADLVGALREITNDLRDLRGDEDQRKTTVPERRPPPHPRAAVPPPPPADDQEDGDARKTVESPPPAADDDEPEEELTRVAPRSPATFGGEAQR